MFDIFDQTDDEDTTDDAVELNLGDDDPGETDDLGEAPLAAGDGQTDLDTAPDPEPDGGPADGPNATELEARIDGLEDQLDSTESSIRAVQDSQSEISDTIEEMNDTVRRLTGMYDRLAADENPFVSGPTAETGTGDAAPGDSQVETDSTNANEDGDRDTNADGDEDDPVVSLEDLREDGGVAGSNGHDESAVDADHRTGEQPTREDPEASDRAGEVTPASDFRGDELPTLTSIPDGYAGDVLVLEWLSVLMTVSGSCGTLRAIEHYEDIGWISSGLRDRLVDTIGGPSLDTSLDPTQFPQEPTAETHAMSHDYLRVLANLQDL